MGFIAWSLPVVTNSMLHAPRSMLLGLLMNRVLAAKTAIFFKTQFSRGLIVEKGIIPALTFAAG
jgi:hypothetical protein